MDPIEQIRGIAERVAGSHGLEIFDVQMRRESIGPVLRIVIDRPAPPDGSAQADGDSVGIQDCQRVSEDIESHVDEAARDHARSAQRALTDAAPATSGWARAPSRTTSAMAATKSGRVPSAGTLR